MATISLRLPEDIEAHLAEEARLEGRPRSEVVREAIVDYLARRERERFMAEVVAEARAAYDNPAIREETQALLQEGEPASNEALEQTGKQALPDSDWWR